VLWIGEGVGEEHDFMMWGILSKGDTRGVMMCVHVWQDIHALQLT
jgi:hypothetical protein